MTEENKEEKNNKSKDLKKIRTDFITKRLKKDTKDSLDVLSMFYHILSISNNRDFIRSNFNALRNIAFKGGDQNELNSFVQNLQLNEVYKEIKDIDFGDGYTTEKFLDEYGNSLPKIFNDFDQITKNKNSLDFATIDYIYNRDLMAEMWPEHSDDIARWDKAYVTYKDDELDLELDKIYVRGKHEDVERYNNGINPENNVEIGEDTAIITATAIGAAFPPLLIVTGILFLLRANNIELATKTTEFIGGKKKKLIESLKNKIKQKSHKELNKIITEIDSRSGQAQKLESSLPANWKKVIEATTMPNISSYNKLLRLRENQEKLTNCSNDIDHSLGQQSQLLPNYN